MRTSICILLAIAYATASIASAQRSPQPEPTLISAPDPIYPKAAKEAGIGGRITVKVVVDAQGAIVSVGEPTGPARLCNASDNDPRLEAMRNSVIEAIKQAKFEPAKKDGVPVKAVAFVSSRFDPLGAVAQAGVPRLLDAGSAIVKNAVSMPKPPYPPGARRVRAAGPVGVRVVLTDTGDVFTAEAVSGHSSLQSSAVQVACDAKFRPFEVDGKAVRATGVIFYNFVP